MNGAGKLQQFLVANRIEARIISKPATEATLDACSALAAGGHPVIVDDFIKCLIVKIHGGANDGAAALLVRGSDRVDLQRVRDLLKVRSITIPAADEACRISGYVRGGTPPLALGNIVIEIVDSALITPLRMLYGGGGDPNHVMAIHSDELIRALSEIEGVKLVISSISTSVEER